MKHYVHYESFEYVFNFQVRTKEEYEINGRKGRVMINENMAYFLAISK